MLRLEETASRIGAFSLGPLDLTVEPGACHALLGPSGSGKSTALELIVGFRRPLSGRILMNGRDLSNIPVHARGIGYLPQRLALFPHLTVRDNILYGIRCRRKPNKTDRNLIDALTTALGIDHLIARRPESLSGGERQRTALARALAPAPDLLVFDEPFSALNETLRRELWQLFKRLRQEYRLTVLMVTHDLDEAFFLGDQISILIDGKLHQTGAKRSVFRRPATIDAAHFLGVRNIFSAEVIGKEGDSIVLDCRSLGGRLTVDNSRHYYPWLQAADRVAIGIRSELVALRSHNQEALPDEIRLDGNVVDIAETGRSITLSFRPSNCDVLVEVNAGVREAAALDLARIQIGLPASHLFCIPV